MENDVLLNKDGFVAEIVLNRPAKMNAITPAMAATLEELCHKLDRDDEVRVVLVRGAGSAGVLRRQRPQCAGGVSDAPGNSATGSNTPPSCATMTRKPVVAALHGWVLGGGAELALAADIRVMGRSAKFGFPEVTRGWVGGGGASQMLPRLVGYGQAMRLLLTGDPIDAEEAHRLGLAEYPGRGSRGRRHRARLVPEACGL